MRRVLLLVAATVGLLLSLPVGAAAHEGLCPGATYGEAHAGLAESGAIPEGHLPGGHFGFAGLCLHVEQLPDANPGT